MAKPSDQPMSASEQVNRAQREYWTKEGPRQYQAYGHTIEAGFAPFGRAMFDAARLRPGERVLDVGCGFGTTGVDISAAMLEPARQRLAAAAIGNIELLEADAQVHPFAAGAFDAMISRFGLMFFEDPDAALANLARALRPGGRLVFVCWPDPMKSEWVAVALGVAVAQVGRPPDLGPPGAPGTFAFCRWRPAHAATRGGRLPRRELGGRDSTIVYRHERR
jgi:SAM-dependent methyltransferase